MSKILDNLFLGSYTDAKNVQLLQNLKITHLVTLGAELKAAYPRSFKYLYIPAKDSSDYDMSRHFEEITNFIHDAIELGRGRVLVHCYWGISRSATAVMAYLMKFQNMALSEVMSLVKNRRDIVYPNEGFMEQLESYEKKLSSVKDKRLSHERCSSLSTSALPKKLSLSNSGYGTIDSNRSSYRSHIHYRSSSISSISSLDISALKRNKNSAKTPFMDCKASLLAMEPSTRKNEHMLNKITHRSSSQIKQMDYSCKECGSGLFSKSDVLHNANIESKGSCSTIYIKYKPWFGSVNIDWRSILCPNSGCASTIGFINQKGGKCPCGKHFTAMYFVHNTKITCN